MFSSNSRQITRGTALMARCLVLICVFQSHVCIYSLNPSELRFPHSRMHSLALTTHRYGTALPAPPCCPSRNGALGAGGAAVGGVQVPAGGRDSPSDSFHREEASKILPLLNTVLNVRGRSSSIQYRVLHREKSSSSSSSIQAMHSFLPKRIH